jgi:ABC-type arginine transport system permease subunit
VGATTVTFNVISGLLTGLIGLAALVMAVIADVTGRRFFFYICAAEVAYLVVMAIIRFAVLG